MQAALRSSRAWRVILRYRAVLNFDYATPIDNNQYQKLVSGLIQLGWTYVETSALIVETDEISAVWNAVELCARQDSSIGEITALTLHVQGAPDFAGQVYKAAKNHPNAVEDIRAKPLP